MSGPIKTIYISNILEGYYKSYFDLPKKKREFWTEYDTLDGNRALLYGDDNKIIITSSPIHPEHFASIIKLMGWKNVVNLFPAKPDYSISEDCYSDSVLKKELTKIIKNNPGVAIIPYRLTPQFQKLVSYLTKKGLTFIAPETIPQDKQFILTYFNTKRGFRHLWHLAQADNPPHIQIPEGFIAENKAEAIEAAWWFKMHHKSFVMKFNKGTQGIGIHLINHKEMPTNKDEFTEKVKKMLSDKIWRGSAIIIEETVAINDSGESASPSIEIFIDPDGRVSESYPCDQVLAEDKKTFRGIYIYPDLYRDPNIQHAFNAGKKFGQQLAKYGYRGVFDIDLIRSNDNMMYAVESNLRRTGGTHLHEFCLALLGKQYGLKYHALIEDVMLKAKHGLTYTRCTDIFKDLIFNRKRGSGIIFSNPDMLKVNILMVIVIARDKSELQALRKEICLRLDSLCA